jgi:molybdate transport system ATP-binding protein
MRQSVLEVNFRLQRGGFELALNERFELDGVTVLFGPNGSGKSMSLRTIAGLEPDAMGRVKFNDEVWQDTTAGVFLPAHKRPVTLVFQDARLFAHLDVSGNLRFAERRARRDGPEVVRDEVIAAFEIGHLLDRQPAGLSGGERQRVVMARALLTRPSLILMDEPLAALDVQRRAQALSFIEQIPERFSIPLVYVTHQIDEVVRLASQLVLIANGKVEAQGPAADLMARLDLPPFTGRFEAGSLIEARITAQDDAFMLTTVELEPGLVDAGAEA